jgi:hypothetical protein
MAGKDGSHVRPTPSSDKLFPFMVCASADTGLACVVAPLCIAHHHCKLALPCPCIPSIRSTLHPSPDATSAISAILSMPLYCSPSPRGVDTMRKSKWFFTFEAFQGETPCQCQQKLLLQARLQSFARSIVGRLLLRTYADARTTVIVGFFFGSEGIDYLSTIIWHRDPVPPTN